MAQPPKSSEYISDHDLQKYIDNGGINQFCLPWKTYAESPYAEQVRMDAYWKKKREEAKQNAD